MTEILTVGSEAEKKLREEAPLMLATLTLGSAKRFLSRETDQSIALHLDRPEYREQMAWALGVALDCITAQSRIRDERAQTHLCKPDDS